MEIHNMFCVLITLTISTTFVSGRGFLGNLLQSVQNVQPCPSGVSKVSCMISPCEATSGCRAFPNSQCRDDYCGGCNAKFFVGNDEVTSRCDANPAVDAWALSKTSADNCPPIRCFMNPCESAKCPLKPSASCRQHKCECKPTFWEGLNEVTEQCTQSVPGIGSLSRNNDLVALSRSSAEPDCPPVRCFVSPCETATCPMKPSASCRQHKCECKATFWEGLVEVTDQCTQSALGTRSLFRNSGGIMGASDCGALPKVQCSINPCDVNSCPEVPNAQCRTNYCGTCGAEFWVGSNEVTSQCNAGGLALNTGSNNGPIVATSNRRIPVPPPVEPTPCLSSCFFPPCRLSYCAAFPNAECRDNYCGGCRAQYFMGSTEVTSMCNDRVPTLSRMFSGRRRQRTRSIFSPWMAFLDGLF